MRAFTDFTDTLDGRKIFLRVSGKKLKAIYSALIAKEIATEMVFGRDKPYCLKMSLKITVQ